MKEKSPANADDFVVLLSGSSCRMGSCFFCGFGDYCCVFRFSSSIFSWSECFHFQVIGFGVLLYVVAAAQRLLSGLFPQLG